MNNKQEKANQKTIDNLTSIDFEKIKENFNNLNVLKFSYMRIQSIEVWNFRNIEHGKINFPNAKPEDIRDRNPSLLGLYGQNGSGKTSIIMAISILKDLLSGLPLGNKYESCINSQSEKCSLSFELGQVFLPSEMSDLFSFSNNQKIYYTFDITKTEDENENKTTETHLHVINEVLSYKATTPFGKKIISKQKLFDARLEESDDKGRPFGNKARFTSIVGNNLDITNKLVNAKAVAYDRGTSFIFSKNTISALDDCIVLLPDISLNDAFHQLHKLESEYYDLLPAELLSASDDESVDSLLDEFFEAFSEEQRKERYELIKKKSKELTAFRDTVIQTFNKYIFFSTISYLSLYGKKFLFTIDTTSTGLVSVNEQWPILLWNLDTSGNVDSYRVFLNLDKPSSIPENNYVNMKASVSAVSKVLSAVVPGISIEITDLGKQIAKDGKTTVCIFEVMSCRGKTTIPLRFESDGIRRLVSILSLLIAAYNQPFFTIAIDEIDAGIFEYLLGEILKILSNSAKGQIIFTSHNLRPLEVLPPKFLCFTTTNSNKKFVRLQNRGNSNFRDGYFRNIILGTSEDSIYSPTDQYEIEMAFYEAGQEWGEADA